MTLAEQQYRAHLERQRRLRKISASPRAQAPAATSPMQPDLPQALTSQSEPRQERARRIAALQREVKQLSARLKTMVREDDSPLAVPTCEIKSVVNAVAEYYRISLNDIVCHRRGRTVARARQVAMYLTKQLTIHTLPAIGRVLHRNHGTILHGCRKITMLRAEDPLLDAQIRELTDRLTPDHE